MLRYRSILLVLLLQAGLHGQVVSYEGNTLPEHDGWERLLADTPGAERYIVDGSLVQSVDLPDGWAGPFGDAEFYRVSLGDFADAGTFFVEWRVETDNPPDLLDLSATPVVVSIASDSVIYHTTLTDGAVQLFRRTFIPLVFVDVAPSAHHVYRVELHGPLSFAWYVDGIPVESGVPLASYPDSTARLIWGVHRQYVDSITR